jgi:hypothetical protein
MPMMQTRLASAVALAWGWLAFAHAPVQELSNTRLPVPLADHHQHLFSPELAALMMTTAPVAAVKPRPAADLIAQLDAAGIKRAVVLSTAYIFEQPSRNIDNAAEKLKRDNDWTSRQVAQFPDRLIGFCGLNPLKAALNCTSEIPSSTSTTRRTSHRCDGSSRRPTTVGWRSWRTCARRSQRSCRGGARRQSSS